MATPLILTATLDDETQLFFNKQRGMYFPPERNFLQAHLTLFHRLPPDEDSITETLEALCLAQPVIQLRVTKVVSLGNGIAYKTESEELAALHQKLQRQWRSWLIPQDRQTLWQHVTVQNKVAAREAKITLERLTTEFKPFTAYAKGLTLWQYLNGPWQLYRIFLFGG